MRQLDTHMKSPSRKSCLIAECGGGREARFLRISEEVKKASNEIDQIVELVFRHS
jgi:hypothetical protein